MVTNRFPNASSLVIRIDADYPFVGTSVTFPCPSTFCSLDGAPLVFEDTSLTAKGTYLKIKAPSASFPTTSNPLGISCCGITSTSGILEAAADRLRGSKFGEVV